MDDTAEDFILEIAKAIMDNPSVPFHQRLGIEKEIAEVKKKRRRKAQPSPEDASIPPAESDSSDEKRQERKLVYIRPDGSEAPEDSDECQKIFKDYLDRHKGQQGLEEDLQNIQDYLKAMDLSKGLPRGLYSINNGNSITRGDRAFPRIYQFKPADAVGLPAKSPQGRKIRVLLVMENGTIGSLGLGHRTDIVKLMKSFGVSGRPRRG